MPLTVRIVDAVAHLCLDRPAKLNAIDRAMYDRLSEVLVQVLADDAVRCIVLSGAGENFSSGADIREPLPTPEEILSPPIERQPVVLLRSDGKPSVALIRGYCLGGGLELALAADVRIASETAVFGFAEIDWALTTGWGGSVLLEEIVGRSEALRLLLTGMRFGAGEALRLGLVSEVVADADLDARGEELARRIAEAPQSITSAFRRLVDRDDLIRRIEAERRAFADATQDPEAVRRLAQFGRARP